MSESVTGAILGVVLILAGIVMFVEREAVAKLNARNVRSLAPGAKRTRETIADSSTPGLTGFIAIMLTATGFLVVIAGALGKFQSVELPPG